jgi:hypothetical protein
VTVLAFRVFYVLGGMLAVWAVVLAALGLSNVRFPGTRGRERVVIGISIALVVGAIGSAVVTSNTEHFKQPGVNAPGTVHK